MVTPGGDGTTPERPDLRAAYACPDCSADTRLTEEAPGVYVLTVEHDDTCPTYRAMP
jgi:hypothetical protein